MVPGLTPALRADRVSVADIGADLALFAVHCAPTVDAGVNDVAAVADQDGSVEPVAQATFDRVAHDGRAVELDRPRFRYCPFLTGQTTAP